MIPTTARQVRRVHVWAPEFAAPGGIQRYSRFLIRALVRRLPLADIEVFSLHDRSNPFPDLRCAARGCWPRPLRSAVFALNVTVRALVKRPDLVILTHAHFAPLAAPLLRWLKIPFWVCAHGYEVWAPKNDRVRRSLFEAERILAVSEFTKSRLLEIAPAAARANIRVLPNTFDEELFTPGEKSPALLQTLGIEAESKVILTVARLDASEGYKGYDRIIRSLEKLRSRVPHVHYLLVGDGDDRSRIELLIEQANVSNLVTLAGRVPDTELCSFYNLCDVFAMPSTGEGFGIVFLEALACGKPVLAGNQDGSVSALAGGELGRLVDPEDETSLVSALSELLIGEERAAPTQTAATLRQAVVRKFGFDSFCARVGEIFAER